ncbi:MAG: hypothetical protein MJ129_06845 [Clostridia bacterium]|nr:hypothetical protein [Clostridia bacterium]
MKHYFIVNPKSGKNVKFDVLNDYILPAVKKTGVDYEIYETKCAGDGQRFVKETCEALAGEPARFYAVGGDGTLYEVVNGAFGYENAEVTVVPKGSGNDWIRLFGDQPMFLDVEGLINGTPIKVDAIKVTHENGTEIALNQTSMGFDAEACIEQGRMKAVPGAIGHVTYLLAGLYCAITRTTFDFDVKIDGKPMDMSPYCFVAGCNSRWYGSGIKVAPFADPQDHLMDIVMYRRVTSWPVLFKVAMLNWQVKGDHWKRPYVEIIRGKTLEITDNRPIEKKRAINVDGECQRVDGCKLELVDDGITFVIPQASTYLADRENGNLTFEIEKTIFNKEPLKTLLTKYEPYHVLFHKKYRK